MLSAMRRALRRCMPLRLRQMIALIRRELTSWGMTFARQAPDAAAAQWTAVCTVRQAIKQSRLWEGKVHNLQLAAALVDGVTLAPGAVLSIWALVGRPTDARGFALGRAIRDDAEVGDVGGGLCQLSGLIYELGLRTGLTVIERHPHSRDLYASEAERFTPLGLDATVVWPWKDLRLRNDTGQPLRLHCAVAGLAVEAWLTAPGPVQACELRLDRSDGPEGKHVVVWRDGTERISSDHYR